MSKVDRLENPPVEIDGFGWAFVAQQSPCIKQEPRRFSKFDA